ncbi:hypothetical protein ACRRTK_022918 [Alexandromys fortis]
MLLPILGSKSRCVKLLADLLGLARTPPQDVILLVNLMSVPVTSCSPPGIFWHRVTCPEPPAFPQLTKLSLELLPTTD